MKPVVLLIEDEEDDVFFAQRAFAKCSVQVDLRVLRDGREALDYFKGQGAYADRKAHPLPCLSFIDLNLPLVSGIDVLRQLRAQPELQRFVVLVLTSSGSTRDVREAYEQGARCYLLKPNQAEALHALLDRSLTYWLGPEGPLLP